MTEIKKEKPLSEVIKDLPGYDPYLNVGDLYYFNEAKAQSAIDFIQECCTQVKGEMALKPYILEPHEKALVANIFGWLNTTTQKRRFREVFYYVPRKNSKTTLATCIILCVLFTDNEPGAELYVAASDTGQARIFFNISKNMILHEEQMSSRCKIHLNSVSYNSSFYKVLSSEAKSKHGFNVHLALIDEVHAQKNSELIDVLQTGTGSRSQPLLLYTTTADFDRESVCNTMHKYACEVRDNTLPAPDLTFLPVIYEASVDDDWTSPEVWARVNPNLGKSVELDYIIRECVKAQVDPSYENRFKRLHLNIRTEQSERWLQMHVWDKNSVPVNYSLKGRECYAGLDLAATTDINAFVMAFPKDLDDCKIGFDLECRFWMPKEAVTQRGKKLTNMLLTNASQGYIILTDGNVADYDQIRRDINALRELYNIKEIGVDRWNAMHIINDLTADDFLITEFGQGFASLSGPSKEFERLVLGEKLNHFGNPVLRWMASNVTVKRDEADNIKPIKEDRANKIDGIIAAIMAIACGMQALDEKSVWDY